MRCAPLAVGVGASVQRAPPGLSETNMQCQKVARAQILAWCVSTCFYIAPEHMSSANLHAPNGSKRCSQKQAGLVLPLPANVSNNAPILRQPDSYKTLIFKGCPPFNIFGAYFVDTAGLIVEPTSNVV
jgi:hypothetical protein